MSKIKLIYMKNIYEIKCREKNLSIQNLLAKYCSIINMSFNELLFLYKGKILDLNNNKKVNEFKDNNIIILVYNLKIKKKNNYNEKFKDIICPECNNLAIINSNNNKISLNCLNNHRYSDISLNFFNDTQYIDESLINCQKCENNKCYYNRFFICSNNKYICPLCLDNNEYKTLDFDYRFNFCINHNLKYLSYCNICSMNLCEKCESEHQTHQITLFKKLKPNDQRIMEINNEKVRINKYKEELIRLNEYFNDFFK